MKEPRVRRFLDSLCGACFLLGASSLLLMSPEHSLEEVRALTGASSHTMTVLLATAAAGVETALGLSLLLRGGRTVRRLAIALLLALTAALLLRGLTDGWALRCRCFGAFFEQGLVAAIVRNIVLMGTLAWPRLADRPCRARVPDPLRLR